MNVAVNVLRSCYKEQEVTFYIENSAVIDEQKNFPVHVWQQCSRRSSNNVDGEALKCRKNAQFYLLRGCVVCVCGSRDKSSIIFLQVKIINNGRTHASESKPRDDLFYLLARLTRDNTPQSSQTMKVCNNYVDAIVLSEAKSRFGGFVVWEAPEVI